jgi:2-phospho-L-lactate/phosphoenolpyruvate guanylyltransferase
MNLYALVPVKDPALGKSRLRPVLADEERRELNLSLARRTLEATTVVFRTVVVTSSDAVEKLCSACSVVREGPRPIGLNAALVLAARHAIAAGAEGLLVVPADLPLVSPRVLQEEAAGLQAGECLLVPDARGTGTNLLGLAPARLDLFRFGAGSLRRHAAAAARAGFSVRLVSCPALARDLDLPSDLRCQGNFPDTGGQDIYPGPGVRFSPGR